MKTEAEELNNVVHNVAVGDIIRNRDNFFIVMQFKDEFVAKNLTGIGGLHGVYPSMHEFNKALNKSTLSITLQVLSQNDYKLVITKK